MTPAGTSNELDVQNEWEENTHTHTLVGHFFFFLVRKIPFAGIELTSNVPEGYEVTSELPGRPACTFKFLQVVPDYVAVFCAHGHHAYFPVFEQI